MAACLAGTAGCKSKDPSKSEAPSQAKSPPAKMTPNSNDTPDSRASERQDMVARQIKARGVDDPRVLAAMRAVPRHEFVPDSVKSQAYRDGPLPIGHDQTISQPLIVAMMTELAKVGPGDKVLEIGTGSGYQAAVLAELGAEVYSVEIVEPLGERARATLERLGYECHLRIGDGYAGWPEAAPFDAIILTAAPPSIPEPLLEQLAEGGRMVAPVGRVTQELRVVTRSGDDYRQTEVIPVRFVPMTGRAQQ